MKDYQQPELLRASLAEVCLQAKVIAASSESISDFLGKAPEVPADRNIKMAIDALKQIQVLDSDENLTELGEQLSHLPLEPMFARMLVIGVTLGCLDPILTIASVLAYRDPFVLPMDPALKVRVL